MPAAGSELRRVTAGGTNIGHHIVKRLAAKPSQFTVDIIARTSSKSSFPEGVKVHYVNNDTPHDQLVKILVGQDVLISAIGFGSISVQNALIEAAIEAKVKRFIPSEYGVNNTAPTARALSPVFDAKGGFIEYLQSKESTGLSWTSVATGLWLDWTLEPDISFADINIKTRTAKLWNNGTHKLSWSTLPWAAEGIAQILLAGELTANKVVPLHGFEASQKEIISALQKLQNVTYDIGHVDSREIIKNSQSSWVENKDMPSAIKLVQAGFLLDGYGSNLVTEGVTRLGNEYLTLPPLTLDEVVEASVKQWA
ncbi:uncharacterized protein A1O9_06417 [Exophiala aquamarina CBS 119918]|uniref:NmrA-like domain-containing protein n=1 Tax=Exophiala aquamarina CBS 119918 TaxID=1182545 RepID=A0A072PF37_9EURO|nr:uncharacterized protein A1O9_06417 [Exophiala aquamarina CBS 119918]KEF58491.1 hypothetical protein A1O9_06417 [Exophiala aquamarina CBS 119918]